MRQGGPYQVWALFVQKVLTKNRSIFPHQLVPRSPQVKTIFLNHITGLRSNRENKYCIMFTPFYFLHVTIVTICGKDLESDFNTFAASYLNTQGLNNSCLKSPASTLVDLTFQSRALRSFSLNQLRNLSL